MKLQTALELVVALEHATAAIQVWQCIATNEVDKTVQFQRIAFRRNPPSNIKNICFRLIKNKWRKTHM